MTTWREDFEELAAENSDAIADWRIAATDGERARAAQAIKHGTSELTKFVARYRVAGFPDHDDEVSS